MLSLRVTCIVDIGTFSDVLFCIFCLQEASQYLKHSRRSQLLVSDVIHALSDSHVPYVSAAKEETKSNAHCLIPDTKVWCPADRLLNLDAFVKQEVVSETESQPPCLEGEAES